MLDHMLYDLTQNLQNAMFQAGYKKYIDALNDDERAIQAVPPILLQLRTGYAESPGWLLVQAAEFDPDPLTVKRLRVRAIWSSEHIIQSMLELMASEKWLNRKGDEYYLTETGYAVNQRRRERMTQMLSYLGDYEFNHLETLMRRIIDTSIESNELPDTWCLRYSRRRAPADDAAAILKVFQYLSDFNAIRDDAHMASFKEHQIQGYIWESFSFICNEMASTAEALFDQLAYRGYTKQDFAAAIDDLVQRGWVKQGNEGYQAAAQGKAVRERSEALTDQYFYAPWAVLSEQELAFLRDTMTVLQHSLGQ